MFTPKVTKVVSTRWEYEIPAGASRKDVYDALWRVDQDMADAKGGAEKLYDDSWHLKCTDGGAVVYWTEETDG